MSLTQEKFLDCCIESKTECNIFLTSGIRLQGVVLEADSYCILLEGQDKIQLVYKSAISTILPDSRLSLKGID